MKRESERFWSLTAHTRLNVFAAGHDNGMMVFKLQRERPAYFVNSDLLYYVKDEEIRIWDLINEKNKVFWKLSSTDILKQSYHSLAMNSDGSSFVLISKSYKRETFTFGGYALRTDLDENANCVTEISGISGISAVSIGNNLFIIIDDKKQMYLCDSKKKDIHKLGNIYTPVDDIFYAGSGTILLQIKDRLELYDIEQNIVKASVKVNNVRYVIWSKSMEYAALLSKNSVTLVNRELEILSTQQETVRVKSGAWHDDLAFVYNTRNQIKYLLTSGDCGIIKTYDSPLYILAVRESTIYGLNRIPIPVTIKFNPSEYLIKSILSSGRIDLALILMKYTHVPFSRSAYLMEKGYPEIALKFANDAMMQKPAFNLRYAKTCFQLALDFGELGVALKAAERLDQTDNWTSLAEAALFQGNHQIAEICYEKTNNFEKLTFLYFITGNMEKLVEMMKFAEARTDSNAHFGIALFVGDDEEKIKVLNKCGQTCLAYLFAATHGYNDESHELKKELELKGQPLPVIDKDARLLIPPPSMFRMRENWPQVTSDRNNFFCSPEAE